MTQHPLLFRDPAPRHPFPNARAPRPGMPRVAVLLGLRDGADRLGPHLETIARQTHRAWSLSVRDDGSRDRGVTVAEAFAGTMPGRDIRVWGGTHRGPARTMLALIEEADPAADFAAFATQDDLWHPGKLARAVDRLGSVPAGVPALYCGPVAAAGRAMRCVRMALGARIRPGFANALVESIAPGGTMVANRAALELLRIGAKYRGSIPAFDRWAYQVVTGAGGVVVLDDRAMVLRPCRRAPSFCQPAQRSDRTVAALTALSPLFTERNRFILGVFAELGSQTAVARLRTLARFDIGSRSPGGQAALWMAVATGRL